MKNSGLGSTGAGADGGVGRELIRCRRKGTRCCCVPGERSVAAPHPLFGEHGWGRGAYQDIQLCKGI